MLRLLLTMLGVGEFLASSGKVAAEEGFELVPRDEVHAVVKIDVARARDKDQLLRLRRVLVGILAELARVRLIAP